MGEVQTAMAFGVEHDPSVDSDSYCTPPYIWEWVFEFWPYGWDVDPMTNKLALQRANRINWTVADDAFSQKSWHPKDHHPGWKPHTWDSATGWLNPPYSSPGAAIRRVAECHHETGMQWLALLKCDHSTRWWDDAITTCSAFSLLCDRVTFYLGGRPAKGNNFTSAIMYWGHHIDAFKDVFGQRGRGWAYPGEKQNPPWLPADQRQWVVRPGTE